MWTLICMPKCAFLTSHVDGWQDGRIIRYGNIAVSDATTTSCVCFYHCSL